MGTNHTHRSSVRSTQLTLHLRGAQQLDSEVYAAEHHRRMPLLGHVAVEALGRNILANILRDDLLVLDNLRIEGLPAANAEHVVEDQMARLSSLDVVENRTERATQVSVADTHVAVRYDHADVRLEAQISEDVFEVCADPLGESCLCLSGKSSAVVLDDGGVVRDADVTALAGLQGVRVEEHLEGRVVDTRQFEPVLLETGRRLSRQAIPEARAVADDGEGLLAGRVLGGGCSEVMTHSKARTYFLRRAGSSLT